MDESASNYKFICVPVRGQWKKNGGFLFPLRKEWKLKHCYHKMRFVFQCSMKFSYYGEKRNIWQTNYFYRFDRIHSARLDHWIRRKNSRRSRKKNRRIWVRPRTEGFRKLWMFSSGLIIHAFIRCNDVALWFFRELASSILYHSQSKS